MDALISTFRGNPKACAAGLKTIEILVRDSLVDNARELGDYTLQRLRDLKENHKNIKEVRGLGLISGIEFANARTADYILSRMLNKHHIIIAKFDYRKDMLRLQPSLIVKKEEIDQVIDALDEACSNSNVGLALGAGRTALGRIVKPPK